MRQAYRIIPVYTADVSGVCSALFELGGMTVMHDPSGCNSTYNTHDEIRWYDQDSLIYISGLTDRDAIMGNDEKFLADIMETARELRPAFIALAGSPIPYLNGTDFYALAEILEGELGIPVFAVPTNGMHDYVSGVGMALEAVARRLVIPEGRRASVGRSVNLLGVTPLDFGPLSRVEEMCRSLEERGWRVNTVWAMGNTLEELKKSGESAVNLVVSSVGIRAAKAMREEWGMPYVVGTPTAPPLNNPDPPEKTRTEALRDQRGGTEPSYREKTPAESFTETLCQALDEAAEGDASVSQPVYLRDRLHGPAEIALIGEPVTMGSLAAELERRIHRPVRILCPLEEWEGLLAETDATVRGEEELEEALTGTRILAADPLYRPVCPAGCRFVELPHIAFSGRIYAGRLILPQQQVIRDILEAETAFRREAADSGQTGAKKNEGINRQTGSGAYPDGQGISHAPDRDDSGR